jgi:hypothetical protein
MVDRERSVRVITVELAQVLLLELRHLRLVAVELVLQEQTQSLEHPVTVAPASHHRCSRQL